MSECFVIPIVREFSTHLGNEAFSNTKVVEQKQEINMDNFVSRDEFNNITKRLDRINEKTVTRDDERIGIRLRWNRPLKWYFKWNGEEKYAVPGKPRLEYWSPSYKCWEEVIETIGAAKWPRLPN